MPFADWKADATIEQSVVAVCFNRALFAEWAAASEQLQQARHGHDDVEQLAARLVDLTEQVEADKQAHTFTFETVPYSIWRGLVEEHPPTDQQRDGNRYLDYNPDTFPPVAVAAACVDPELTVDDGQWLREHLPRLEFDRLFEAAFQVSVGGGDLPKSVIGIAKTLASGLKSTTAANEASPSPGSEGG
jgi:hypothetical protein